jgi:AraC-like DNA-binding protein
VSFNAAYPLNCDKRKFKDDMEAHMPIIRDIIYAAVARGGDLKTMCAETGVDVLELNDSGKMAPFDPAAKVWDVTIAHTGDPLLGLHMGEEISTTILGMIGYLMQNSVTLFQALEQLCAFNDLYSTMMKFNVRKNDNVVEFVFEPAPLWTSRYPESVRQSIELSMAGTLRIFKTLSGKNIYPTLVEQTYPKRKITEYERIFQCALKFNASRNALSFASKDLEQPVVSHDKSLFNFFNSTLQQKLNSLKINRSTAEKVKHTLLSDFKGRMPSIEIVALHLGLTPRSLQRKLKDESLSFRELTATLKKELALSIMKKERYSAKEVADVLGYSDSSAFRKAFKNWSK